MKYFYFDFETRSKLDLMKVGRKNYFDHESTMVTLLTYAVDDGPIKHWYWDNPMPRDLGDILCDARPYYKVAHNIAFDIECMKMFKSHHWMSLKNFELAEHWKDKDTWIDTMALTDHARFGSSLDSVSTYLNIDKKNKVGKAAMTKQSKPAKDGTFPVVLDEEEEKVFIEYGKHDVIVCREILKHLSPHLPPFEKRLWNITYDQNKCGIPIDKDLVKLMKDIVVEQGTKLTKRFHEIFQGKYNTIGSPKLKEFFKRYYPYCDNLKAETVEQMWNDTRKVPQLVREVLYIKKQSSSSSVAKVKKILDVEYGEYIYDNLHYHKDHNKRWAGHGVQIQNFPRSVYKEGDLDYKDDEFLDNAKVSHLMGDLDIPWVKNNLRRVFKAHDGKKLFCADLGKIEPTVIFWLCGMGQVPSDWYEQQAANIYGKKPEDIGKDSEERQLGKTACLSCGYGAGAEKFQGICRKEGINISGNMAITAVQSYRQLHPQVTQWWRGLGNAFKQAEAFGVSNYQKKIYFSRQLNTDGKSFDIVIALPSGSQLFYRRVKVDGDEITYLNPNKGRVHLWGGTIFEHVVSALARDILGYGLINLVEAGYHTLGTIHDEIWILSDPQIPKDLPLGEHTGKTIWEKAGLKVNPPLILWNEDDIKKDILKIMTKVPEWAKGLKNLTAELVVHERYAK